MNTTPLRDVLRGEWSCRLSYRRVLRESSLPSPIVEVIEKIIRRARLWRRERFDVARELITHFQEGMERGVPAALLIDQFGAVPLTSRLIRRAKLRQRPAWWKTWYAFSRTMLAIIAILIGVYSVQAVRFFTGKPVITHNYLKEMNDTIRKIPMEDRAWPLYVNAMRDFPKWPKGVHSFIDAGPQKPEWDRIVEIVRANKDRIAAIRVAASKPCLGWMLGDPNDPSFQLTDKEDERFGGVKPNREYLEITNPFVIRASVTTQMIAMEAARLLWLDAKVAAVDGDADRVRDSLTASVRIADQMFQGSGNETVVGQLIGMSIFNSTSNLLEHLLVQYPSVLTSEHLRDLFHTWASFNAGKLIRFSFVGERLMDLDVLQRIYTAGPGGHYSYEGWKLFKQWHIGPLEGPMGTSFIRWNDGFGPIAMTIAVDRQRAESEFDDLLQHMIKAFGSRPWEWKEDGNQLIRSSERTFLGFYRNPLIVSCFSPVNSMAHTAEMAELRRSTVLIALSLTIFKRDHDRWPERLDELVPHYLPSMPLDPNDGQPLRYRLTEAGPLVYSVGNDHHDDHGKPTKDQREKGSEVFHQFSTPEKGLKIHNDPHNWQNGDWVLWPPLEKEGAKPPTSKVE